MKAEADYQTEEVADAMASPVAVAGDDTTAQLTRIWQELLGVEPIEADQNYFDLGGDSILAVQLFAHIQKVFQVKLPVATLFEAPTIEELVRILRRDTAPTSGWSPLVPIQAPSFFGRSYYACQKFVFHAVNFFSLESDGRVKFFWEKAEALRSRIPVWRGMLLAKLGKGSRTAVSESRVLAQIWRANDRACWDYVPKPYPGVVTDFRPLKQYRMFNKRNAKWDRLARAEEVVVLPVYPAGMLVEPFVKHLAIALKKSIDGAICGCATS